MLRAWPLLPDLEIDMAQITTATPTPPTATALTQTLLDYADNNGLLKSYRDDLNLHDRLLLEQMGSWPTFLWVAGESFSNLYPIGLHQNHHDAATAVLDSRGEVGVVAKLDGLTGKLTTINRSQADKLLLTPCWKRVDTVLLDAKDNRVGYVYLAFEYRAMSSVWLCTYHFAPQSEKAKLHGAVSQWVLGEAVQQKGLFTQVVAQP